MKPVARSLARAKVSTLSVFTRPLAINLTKRGLATTAWQPGARPLLRSGLLIGSGITIGVLVALVAYIAIGFNTFFVQFHRVFFQGDSWLFRWSDTLIRLFPEKFWFDVFLWIAGLTLAEAGLIGALAWWGLKSPKP